MSTHNICLYGELEKIIPELSPKNPSKQVLCMLDGVFSPTFAYMR